MRKSPLPPSKSPEEKVCWEKCTGRGAMCHHHHHPSGYFITDACSRRSQDPPLLPISQMSLRKFSWSSVVPPPPPRLCRNKKRDCRKNTYHVVHLPYLYHSHTHKSASGRGERENERTIGPHRCTSTLFETTQSFMYSSLVLAHGIKVAPLCARRPSSSSSYPISYVTRTRETREIQWWALPK